MGGDAPGCVARAGRFPGAIAAQFWEVSGCHGERRTIRVPLVTVALSQCRFADAARGVCRGRAGIYREARAAECGGGLHPADSWVARIRPRRLLAQDAGLCRNQRAERHAPAALVLLV